MHTSVINLQSVKYGWQSASAPLLDIPQLQIAAGEKVFLYGPSGSGKSTLLNLIAGVVPPQAGSLHILGKSLTELNNRQRDQFRAAHMGIIFQQFNLIPYLNLLDNVKLRMEFLPREKRDIAQQQLMPLLERLQLTNFIHHKAWQLSVGQQQRVAMARALIGQPDIIIADEPTSALDAELRETFMTLLFESLAKNTCLLMVSHDQQLIPHFDRVINIQQFRTDTKAGIDAEATPCV